MLERVSVSPKPFDLASWTRPKAQVQQFRHGNRTMRYRCQGEGPPLVLIHGLSGSARWWRYNIPALAQHYEVFSLELLGGVGVQDAAQLIVAWLRALGLDKAVVIGHSMGGQIALNVASLAPQQVSRLVLACASGLLHGSWWKVALKLPRAGLSGRPRFVPVVVGDSLRTGLPNLYRAARDLLRNDVAELLPALKVPTLVIWGGRDPLVPPALGELLSRSIPGAQYVVLPRAGHVVMVDEPAAFNAAVLAFLAEPQP